MAVALEGGVCAAALQNHVDVWDHSGSRRVCLGAPVSALCFHSEFLFVSAGCRIAVWDVQVSCLVGTLKQHDGALVSLGWHKGGIIYTTMAKTDDPKCCEDHLKVWRRRPPVCVG